MFDLMNTMGSFERQADSTHVVSLWYIPNGTDYDRAKATTIFFSDKDRAEKFANHWSQAPEMAMTFTIEQHDKIRADVKERDDSDSAYTKGRYDACEGSPAISPFEQGSKLDLQYKRGHSDVAAGGRY